MTGLSRQQITRLVQRYRKSGKVASRRTPPKKGFSRRFDLTDVALLAEMDALHNTLSGPATKKLMERAVQIFGDTRFDRLAGKAERGSDAGIPPVNLRGGKPYQSKRRH